MGFRALEKREKLGDLFGNSDSLELSRLILVRRGAAGFLKEDNGEITFGEDSPAEGAVTTFPV